MRYYVERLAGVVLRALLLTVLFGVSEVGAVPGSIVNFWDPENDQYIGDPSIAILPNGDYIASHDGFGPAHTAQITYVYRSTDQGDTWAPYGNDPTDMNRLVGQSQSTLFVSGGDLYSLGIAADVGANPAGDWLSIRKSTDGGLSWTEPDSPTNGRLDALSSGVGYAGGAAPVLVQNGRVWRSFEDVTSAAGVHAQNWSSFVMSAPVGSDLLDASNWTRSSGVLLNQGTKGLTEGNVVVKPNGDLVNITRVTNSFEEAAFIDINATGTTSTFDQLNPFPGGGSKFAIRYDAGTQKYWTLANDQTPSTNERSILTLNSSPDLTSWTVEGTILEDSNTAFVGFQYVDWQFDGNDIVAASRTAFSGADNFHDTNYLTFHRIRNYASTSKVQSVTLDVAEDAEITNWVNWISDPRGELPESGCCAFGGNLRVSDDNFPNGAWNPPGSGNDSWVLMKWDLSSLVTGDNSKLINNVDLRMIQQDGFTDELEVYRINSGAWTEAAVTWSNWVGGTIGDEDITFLGTMTGTPNLLTKDGITHFSDADMVALVQEWIDGTQDNHGILLKWPTSNPTDGDSYASREHTTLDPPRLIIDFIDNLSADFDRDTDVDGGDFLAWQRGFGTPSAVKADGDANGDSSVTGTDLGLWASQYGTPLPLAGLAAGSATVPEPASVGLVVVGIIMSLAQRRNKRIS
jgi:hypothetical protein